MTQLRKIDDRLVVNVQVSMAGLEQTMRDDVRHGLSADHKELAPKYLYDDRGSELFDAITRLPAYYPTRLEAGLLRAHADDVATRTGAETLVELGSGTSEKTRMLLDAFSRAGNLRGYVPFEINEAFLIESGRAICTEYPNVTVHGVVGDFNHHIGHIPDGNKRLFAFLGGTIGNLYPSERTRLLAQLVSTMAPGEMLLLGTDLVKPEARLLAAYDDDEGVTAEFILNLLSVLNQTVGADFDLKNFAYDACWNRDKARLELGVRSLRAHVVRVEALDLNVSFAKDEVVRAEISSKFTNERIASELDAAGFDPESWWTDEDDDYALSLWRRR